MMDEGERSAFFHALEREAEHQDFNRKLISRLVDRNAQLSTEEPPPPRPAEPKSLRRLVLEWLFAGGAIVAISGAGLDYLANDQGDDQAMEIAACERADAAIRDEGLNSEMLPAERLAFKARKLRISQKCDTEAGL